MSCITKLLYKPGPWQIECDMTESPAWTKRVTGNCTPFVMNSTVQDHQFGAESRAIMNCELSTINNSVMPLKRVTDTPAKVFARLKAKVQLQNLEEHREAGVIPSRSVLLSTNMQQPPVDDGTSEQQDTYVLTLSPPRSTSKNSELEDPQMTTHLGTEGCHNPDLVHSNIISVKINKMKQ